MLLAEKKDYIMLVSKEHTETKRSLILAGGGMRVAYQTGVLMALEESGIKFSHVDGTSGGIFNTGMLASGLEPGETSGIRYSLIWASRKIKSVITLL